MKRKGVLPKISGCPETGGEYAWKLEGRMFEAAYICAVLAALAVAHIHMQFMRADIALQHSELQKQHRVLRQEERMRTLRYEAMCDPSRLAVAAKAADLREIDVRSHQVAVVSAQLQQKYSQPSAPAAYPQPMLAGLESAGEGLAGMLLSLLETGSAFADTLPEI